MCNADKKNERLTMMVKAMKRIGILLMILFIIGNFTTMKVSAAGSMVNVSINYIEEIATVTSTAGSTKFYLSTDKKSWEIIDNSGVVDISGILQSKSNTVYFKGNKDTEPREIVLPAEDSSLKVTYSITKGVGAISYTSTSAVEYRKGVNGAWKSASPSMSTAIYEIKGTTLYFRTIATADKRAGKVVSVKISKRPSAPSVKLDGSKLAITGLKEKLTEYRVGDSTIWIPFLPAASTIKSINLSNLLLGTAISNIQIPAGTIEFRTIGADKKLYSGVKVIEVPAQLAAPDTIAVTGSTLSITDSDTKRAYEYTVVSLNYALDMSTAKWKSASSKYAVIIPKVSVGDKVLVRLKSKTDSTTKQLVLASTYKEFPISSITVKK